MSFTFTELLIIPALSITPTIDTLFPLMIFLNSMESPSFNPSITPPLRIISVLIMVSIL